MMRLKARIYLWSEATDFKTFAAKNEGDGSSEAVLVSLFRDLGPTMPIPFLRSSPSCARPGIGWVRSSRKRSGVKVHSLMRSTACLNAAKAELLETPRRH